MFNVLDARMLREASINPGILSKESAAAAAKYVETATPLALKGKIDAMVTLPINKEAVQLSMPGFSGHTEFIAGICGTSDYTIMLVSPKHVVTHVSTHVPLTEAIKQVRTERVYRVIRLTHEALSGRKLLTLSSSGLRREPSMQSYCMYHDQGLIPMKLLDFDHGGNIAMGFPIIRTSVDHGTAFDIAWQGKASTASLVAAVEFAFRMVGRTRDFKMHGEFPDNSRT